MIAIEVLLCGSLVFTGNDLAVSLWVLVSMPPAPLDWTLASLRGWRGILAKVACRITVYGAFRYPTVDIRRPGAPGITITWHGHSFLAALFQPTLERHIGYAFVRRHRLDTSVLLRQQLTQN